MAAAVNDEEEVILDRFETNRSQFEDKCALLHQNRPQDKAVEIRLYSQDETLDLGHALEHHEYIQRMAFAFHYAASVSQGADDVGAMHRIVAFVRQSLTLSTLILAVWDDDPLVSQASDLPVSLGETVQLLVQAARDNPCIHTVALQKCHCPVTVLARLVQRESFRHLFLTSCWCEQRPQRGTTPIAQGDENALLEAVHSNRELRSLWMTSSLRASLQARLLQALRNHNRLALIGTAVSTRQVAQALAQLLRSAVSPIHVSLTDAHFRPDILQILLEGFEASAVRLELSLVNCRWEPLEAPIGLQEEAGATTVTAQQQEELRQEAIEWQQTQFFSRLLTECNRLHLLTIDNHSEMSQDRIQRLLTFVDWRNRYLALFPRNHRDARPADAMGVVPHFLSQSFQTGNNDVSVVFYALHHHPHGLIVDTQTRPLQPTEGPF